MDDVKKGFTLVELLVVVAILGVLAAVGIVTFGGFLGNAKENASRTNHKQVVQFVQASIMKCDMGGELILKHNSTTDTSNLCSKVFSGNTEDMINHFLNHFDALQWCNAYGKMHDNGQTCEEGVRKRGGLPGEGGDLGAVKLSTEGTKIVIDTRVLENGWITDRVELVQ